MRGHRRARRRLRPRFRRTERLEQPGGLSRPRRHPEPPSGGVPRTDRLGGLGREALPRRRVRSMSGARPVAVAYDCLFPYTTGGGERQYRAFAEAMVSRGESVEYLTARQWNDANPPRESFAVREITPELTLHDASGVRRISAAARFAAGLFRSLLRRRRAYSAVLVSGLPVLNVFAARLALLGSGTPLAVDYLEVWGRHQWIEYAGGLMGNVAWGLQRLAIAVTPIATCHSQLSANRLRAEGFRGELLLSPGLIDDRTADASSQPAPVANPPFVLYAGRHIPDKRVEALPAAIAVAREDFPDLRLVILGEGPQSAAIDEAIRAVNGADWSERPGFVSEETLTELMSTAAVLVNPSRREGYGLVVVEAAASGTPVVLVADPSNAAIELVSPGVNGAIAPDIDPASLGGAIRTVLRGGADLRHSTRAWYDDAVRTRTIGRTVDGILAAFDRARKKTRGARSASAQEGPL
ncbi:glycosyl transferase family 1 [Microbacterium sp. Ru50]|nr:glycosyl transferase family 1 [Microbacterium sp. Ru50]